MSYINEGQHYADLGNGYYLNPTLVGDYPDPSIIRVGNAYYMTHSTSTGYAPGLLIWHSLDLVNWEPLGYALNQYIGSIAAPELVHHDNRFYIYFPARRTNWVVTADSPYGPWSHPIDLKVGYIDPGHVIGPDDKRYLHLSDGHMIQLSDDGLFTTGEVRKVYEGWPIPEEWSVECFCLESPKFIYRNGYYYLVVAEGGTSGPATSHMVVISRSKTPWGPWEHSPYNPIIHTQSRRERWWSRGHGTLIDTPQGDWWIVYHAHEKDYYTLGRHTLLEPIEWTDDGWCKIPDGIDPAQPIKKLQATSVLHGMPLSDDFSGTALKSQWRFYRAYEPERCRFTGHEMIMMAKGSSPSDCSPLVCIPTNHAYEIQVELEISTGAEGGLLLFYNSNNYCGLGLSRQGIQLIWRTGLRQKKTYLNSRIHFRIRNDRHEVSLYYSYNGHEWTRVDRRLEVSGYHHNTLGGSVGLRCAIYAAGSGNVTLRNFVYRGH